jgi:transposase
MLKVDDYARIRRAHRDGMTIRSIARQYHHSRRKIREALANPEPGRYTRCKACQAPKLGRFKPIIDEILKTDETAPRKQRHTAARIFRRLVDEHQYEGGYDQVSAGVCESQWYLIYCRPSIHSLY